MASLKIGGWNTGIKYKTSTKEAVTDTVSHAWDTATSSVSSAGKTVTDTVSHAWDTATSSVKNTVETVTNPIGSGVSNGINSISSVAKNVGSNAVPYLKKYWYVPVIIGGVIIGWKMIGTQNTQKLLTSLANLKVN